MRTLYGEQVANLWGREFYDEALARTKAISGRDAVEANALLAVAIGMVLEQKADRGSVIRQARCANCNRAPGTINLLAKEPGSRVFYVCEECERTHREGLWKSP